MFELNYKLIGDDNIRPICPHCEGKSMAKSLTFNKHPNPEMNIGIETARLFVCPLCHKVLGIGTV